MMDDRQTLATLMSTLPQVGRVEWIGVRPAKREPVIECRDVQAIAGEGLQGDRYSGRSGKREVTLLQAEHLPVIASILHIEEPDPAILRRNILVSGLNLLALKDRRFSIGEAEFEMTGRCHPCSRMEQVFGEGGYNAIRGHGGITARIVRSGTIRVGDEVRMIA